MTDDVHKQIDRAYDFAELAVDGVSRVLGISDKAPDRVIDVTPAAKRTALPVRDVKALPAPTLDQGSASASAPAATTTQARDRRPFEILEITSKGKTFFLVTNGIETADCKTRAFAEQVLRGIASRNGGRS